ncbi:MAG: LytR C-terminal domain-containing protein [Ignavibacteriales bacterium]|nr:LytR C-terminal domain-containing protein [Ignavibacteriales bacterium]
MKKDNQRNNNNIDFKTSSINTFLNIVVFLLAAIILYLLYSIFIKITDKGLDQPTNQKEDVEDIIQVEVLNGCGVSGLADRFTDYLRNNNFDVVNYGNYKVFDVKESMVIDRIGNIANANYTAKVLGIDKSNVITQINIDYFTDVTVIIGKDYNKLKPFQ